MSIGMSELLSARVLSVFFWVMLANLLLLFAFPTFPLVESLLLLSSVVNAMGTVLFLYLWIEWEKTSCWPWEHTTRMRRGAGQVHNNSYMVAKQSAIDHPFLIPT
jgi:hypothetical protein